MKMLIDIDRELAEGYVSIADHARLKALARRQVTDLALNILIGFGIVAFTIGFGFLSSSAAGLMIEGATIAVAGAAVTFMSQPRTRFFGHLLLTVGLILFGGAMVAFDAFSAASVFAASAVLFGAAMFIESGLLSALSVVALSCALGASTAYEHAEYTLVVDQPLETIGAFTLLGIVGVAAASVVPRRESVLTIAARTAALLVNFAFLVGSLSGDTVGTTHIPPSAFAIGWALVLLVLAAWAWNAERRWPLITAAVFGSLHFYTQLFERLGAQAGTILVAGLATLAVGLVLKFLLARIAPPTSGSDAAMHQA